MEIPVWFNSREWNWRNWRHGCAGRLKKLHAGRKVTRNFRAILQRKPVIHGDLLEFTEYGSVILQIVGDHNLIRSPSL